MKKVLQNSVVTIRVKGDVFYAKIKNAQGQKNVKPFIYQPIEISYDEHGYERVLRTEEEYEAIRVSFPTSGEYQIDFYGAKDNLLYSEFYQSDVSDCQEPLFVKNGEGYYSNGKYFQPFGVNMAYPTKYRNSNGEEFGVTSEFSFLGLRQYERWFSLCAQNGINLIRIWCGDIYFSPDTEELGRLNYAQFTKLDKLFELANRYKLRLKLTIDSFRYFKPCTAEVNGIFDRYSVYQGKALSDKKWLMDQKCRELWLAKLEEYQKRYACDPALFAVEFWNEMNCYGYRDVAAINDWNVYMAERARKLFPNVVLLNSLGSLDCPWALDCYNTFCFEKFDWLQFHSYFDQGAYYKEITEEPIEAIKNSVRLLKDKAKECGKPLFLAETGAVNDCHSGEFRYYADDDKGMILVDTVYTPFFLGCIAPGNLWHWDGRYLSGKNLYRYFKPFADLLEGIEYPKEKFVAFDFSKANFYCFVLKGTRHWLAFLRNKSFNWKNVLRDNQKVQSSSGEIDFSRIGAKDLKITKIWTEESGEVSLRSDKLKITDLQYGVLLKGNV